MRMLLQVEQRDLGQILLGGCIHFPTHKDKDSEATPSPSNDILQHTQCQASQTQSVACAILSTNMDLV